MEFPNDPKPTEEEMVNSYVKTLAAVVGRHRIKNGFKEEARKEIYSVSTSTYTGFGALIREELSYKAILCVFVNWQAFYGFYLIHISMFQTQVICLLLERSSPETTKW
ncbi:Multiple organellar RNA editing factor 3, mitochondrial, partial [Cucurbita argyrosperma subsp. argyrosperma]